MTSPQTLYARRRSRAIAYGTWESSVIDGGHVAAHLAELAAAGRSRRWISRTSGVSHNIIARMLDRPGAKISRHNADRLLRVTLADRPTGKVWVPPTATQRRLQALAAIGWALPQIGEEAGVHPQTLANARGGQPRVTATTEQLVARAYARLSVRPRTDRDGRWTAAVARKKGWHPPQAWTEWTIRDAGARPLTEVKQ